MRLSRLASLAALLVTALVLGSAPVSGKDYLPLPESAPVQLRGNYVIVGETKSPNGKYAVIIPKLDYYSDHESEAKNYLVALQPFGLVATLPTKYPTFVSQSNGGVTVLWSADGARAIVRREGKWGPDDIYVAVFADGKCTLADLGALIRGKLDPAFAKSGAPRYNDVIGYVLESEYEPVTFSTAGTVIIDLNGNSNPKEMPSTRTFKSRLRAEFDPVSGKLTRASVERAK